MKSEQLEKRGTVAMERPSFIKEGDVRGTENITSEDIKPPALRIAQSGSKEIKRSEPASYIEDLREGELFNSSSREIYGEDPVRLLIVHQLGHRHLEFAPQSEGGGVIDFNVPDGDPRTEFTESVIDGKRVRVKPRATKFYDFLILLLREEGRNQLMTMSLKSTQLKKAVQLNTLLAQSKMPSFAHLIEASPVPEKKGAFNIYGWRFDPVGYPTEAQYTEASGLYDKLKKVKIEVETEGTEADPEIPF
jgi:hypothetical protein